jgi:hypothetical protein
MTARASRVTDDGPTMKTLAAPDSAWEARLRWGSRRLTAEVLDGRGRTTLKLGDGPEDDVAIGSTARAVLTWTPNGLELRFTPGVEGELSSRGDRAKTFSELVQEGRVKESPEGFSLVLKPDDAATLRIGTLIAEIQKARGRFPRLPIDGRALVFLVLAVIAIGLMVASIMAPAEQPKAEWLHKAPVKQPARPPPPETRTPTGQPAVVEPSPP